MPETGRAPEELRQFCAQLRDLRRLCGAPSLATLRRSMPSTPGISTLSDLLNGNLRRPPRWELIADLVEACSAHAKRQGRQLPTRVCDISEWRKQHDDLTRVLEALRRVKPSRLSEEDSARRVPAKPIAGWDPSDLGVHRSINADADCAPADVSSLTPYILRPHDEELRNLLSVITYPLTVILVGESSTGKTRSCLEALRHCIPDWPIVYAAGARDLREILNSDFDLENHVVWLDEAQSYLDGEDSSEVANLLTRIMINRSKPMVVLGSMWPQYWRQLTTPPQHNQPDYSVRIRKFLGLSGVRRIAVPDDFAGVPVTELTKMARQDPRLNTALRSGGKSHRITQVLAGGAQLLDRYKSTLDTHGCAVITAAMDFRRIGYLSPIPQALLEDSLPGYLSSGDRVASTGWLAAALEGTTEQVSGVRALEPIRLRQGIGAADSYALHDYLANFAQHDRAESLIPRDTWEALNIHAANHDDRVRLAWQAVFRHFNRLAARFLEPVLNSSYPSEEGLRLVWLLEGAGHVEQAMEILRRAAEAGESSAMKHLAERLLRAENYGEATMWLRRAADLDDDEAMFKLGAYPPLPTVPWEEADEWLLRAAMAGNIWAMRRLGYEALSCRNAIEWFRLGAETGEGNLMFDLVKMLEKCGDRAESSEWIKCIDEAGHLHIIGALAEWLEQQRRSDEAEALLRRNSTAGDLTATWNLSKFLERAGRITEAVEAWRDVIESDTLSGMSIIAARQVAAQMRQAESTTEAKRWLRRSADKGSPHASLVLVALGDADDAEDLLRRAMGLGESFAIPPLVDLLERQGRIEEAETLLRMSVETCTHFDCWELLTNLVKRSGRDDEARSLRQFGMEPEGRTADPW